MDLKSLQKKFMLAVNKQDDQSDVTQIIQSSNALTQEQRLKIYQQSIQGNFITVLQAAFPVCYRLVGEQYFQALCRRFIRAHQNFQPDVTEYGHRFAAFIRDFPPVHEELPYLCEVAELEWACHKAMDGPEYMAFDAKALEAVPKDQQGSLVFECPPASSLIASQFPILAIWRSNQPDFEGDAAIDLAQSQDRLIVFRQDWTLWIHPLTAPTFYFLELCREQQTFWQITTRVQQKFEQANIADIFKESVKNGWLVGFSLGKK